MIETIQTSKYTIKQIFKENWDDFYQLNKGSIRETVINNVAKIMNCGNSEKLGYSEYLCPKCLKKHKVAHTCKSRFCNSCGKIKNDEWILKSQNRLLNVAHKHLILTIPSELWLLFASNRHLLKHLFTASSRAVLDYFLKKHSLPGIVAVLHTFGSKLNFNCHIHILVSLGGLNSKTADFKNNDFIAIESLKSRFKTILLSLLRKEFVNNNVNLPNWVREDWKSKFNSLSFYLIQNKLWRSNWYLYLGEKLDNINLTVSYIGRYAKRPSLSETRIIYYSKKEDIVKFTYRDKISGDDKMLATTINVFMGLLVRHIPEKGFHLIRYYGLYANAIKNKMFDLIASKLIALYGTARLIFDSIVSKTKSWRERVKESTGLDPLKCQKCDQDMILIKIHYRIRDGTKKTYYLNY